MITPEQLLAYVDGELHGAALAEVEAAIAADPALAAKAAAHRALRGKLAGAYAPIAEAPPPQRLIDAARAPASASIIAFPRRARTIAAAASALAASFLVGLVIGGGAQSGPIGATEHGLVARAALARALETRLAAEAGADAPIQIGLTFRDRDGAVCRTFRTPTDEGLACRDDGRWRVDLAQRAAPDPQYRMAASSALLEAVQQRIAGEPLDEAAERALRDAGWRETP